jgi:mono/diheme cytochrome c family protein
MNSGLVRAVLVIVAAVLVLAAGIWIGRRTPAEQPQQAESLPPPAPKADMPALQRDPYQRALKIYEFRKAADSGPDRGREIFYYKCWFCHNEFAGPQSAPSLAGLYQRKQLLSGRPASDDGIKDEIRNGGAGMAAYKYSLSDADLNDLVAYIRDHCCWDSKSPPPNPRYRFAEGPEIQ